MPERKARLLAGVTDLLLLADELGELDVGICLDRARLHLEPEPALAEMGVAEELVFH